MGDPIHRIVEVIDSRASFGFQFCNRLPDGHEGDQDNDYGTD